MDLLVEELEFKNKNPNQNNVNFNLHKFGGFKAYTKWKRNIKDPKDENDLVTWLENAKEKQVRARKRFMRQKMRKIFRKLQIPLYDYDGAKKIQFHDTLNGIIGIVYQRLHHAYVKQRRQTIETKIKVGDKLKQMENITIGDEQFW